MLFDRPYTRVRTHFGSFDLVTLVWPHLRWEWQAIIPSRPVVTIAFYHAMEVCCYHSLWAVKLQLCLRLVTLGSIICKLWLPPGNQLKCAGWRIFCIDFWVSIAKFLKNPSRLLVNVQKQPIWSSRLPQEMQRRSSKWAHTSSWDSISSNNVIVWRTCRFHC